MTKTAQGLQKPMPQGDRKKASSRLPAAPVLVSIPVRNTLSVSQIESAAREWEYDSQYRQLSPLTITENNRAIQKLLWFLRETAATECGESDLRAYLAYVATGHTRPGGRWGRAHKTTAVRPRTIRNVWGILRTFFRWAIKQGRLDVSPLERIEAPIARSEAIRPFTIEQVNALLNAAERSKHPKRDRAILLLLFDTGIRASELCGLCIDDLDLNGHCCTVLGKGNKRRQVFFGRDATRALWLYLSERFDNRDQARLATEPVFLSDRGLVAGEPMTRSGLLQLIGRLGRSARLQGVRCSPHTVRHSFAIEFLRNGGNIFSLQHILGHTNLTMTQRYVALAEADIQNQARMFSPVDRLKRGKQ